MSHGHHHPVFAHRLLCQLLHTQLIEQMNGGGEKPFFLIKWHQFAAADGLLNPSASHGNTARFSLHQCQRPAQDIGVGKLRPAVTQQGDGL